MIETALTTGAYDGMVISALQTDTAKTIIAGTDLPIVSVNANMDCPESLSYVGTGNQSAATEGGEAAVKLASQYGWDKITAIRGEKIDDFIDTGCEIITEENAQEHYDILDKYLNG